jgi:glycosyltransferase involved in cell wall biosynthesis
VRAGSTAEGEALGDSGQGIRLTYFAPSDVLIPRVARQCIMSFCEGLARATVDVELVSLDVRLRYQEPTASEGIWETYGIDTRFPLVRLPSLLDQRTMDTRYGQLLTSVSRLVSYSAYASSKLNRGGESEAMLDVAYCLNYAVAQSLLCLRSATPHDLRVVFELHLPPKTAWQRQVLRSVDGVVANTRRLASEVVAKGFVDSRRIVGEHQGVNLEQIEAQRVGRTEARERLGLPLDKRIICYTGKVQYDSREVGLILEAARALPDDTLVLIVGGREDQVERLRARIAETGPTNAVLPGFVSPSQVAYYLFAADALVLYYPAGISLNDYRSPGKIFPYMASGTAVAACDIPVIHELLRHEGNALLVPQERPDLLGAELMRLLDDPALRQRLGDRARRDVQAYTWDERARRVVDFIRALPPAVVRPRP